MAVETSGMVHMVIMGLTDHVFGNVIYTSTFLMLLLVVIALLIRIPTPFALAIPIPFAVTLAAFGYLSVAVAGILSLIFMVFAVMSFIAGLNLN